MNVIWAMKDTLTLAQQYNLPVSGSDSYSHLHDMVFRSESSTTMSYGKLCRWLGFMQGVLAAHGAPLDELKAINKKWADDDKSTVDT